MRSVKVKLDADVGGFVPVIEAAKRSVKDLDDKVEGLDRSLGKTSGEFKQVYYEAGKYGTALLAAGKEAGTAARKTDELGDQMAQLNRRILETTASLKLLAAAYAMTGDETIKVKIKQEQSALNDLNRVRKILTGGGGRGGGGAASGALGAGGAAGRVGSNLFQAIPFNPETVAAIGGTALVTAPFWAGALGGAAIGGGALTGVGLGAAGAVMGDPDRFKAAWGAAIGDIKQQWTTASAGFAEPTERAIKELRDMVASIHLDQILGKAAKFMDPIISGLSNFGRNVGQGVEDLLNEAGPVVDVLSHGLDELGQAIKMAFDDIAGGSEGGAEALKDLIGVLAATIVAIGKFIGGMEHAYEWLIKIRKAVPGDIWDDDKPKAFGQTMDDLGAHLDDTAMKSRDAGKGMNRLGEDTADAGKAAEQAGKGFARTRDELEVTATSVKYAEADWTFLTKAMYNTADAADSVNAAFDRLFGEMLSVDEANLHVKEGFLKLKQSLEKNGTSLDDNTEKGQANVRGILEQIKVLEEKRQADIKAGDGTLEGTQKANEAYAKNLAELRKLLVSLGYAPAAIDAIISKYQDLASMPDITKTVHINTVYRTSGTPAAGFSRVPGEQFGGIRHAAEGFIVPPVNPGWMMFGEPPTGGEAYIPLRGISQMRAAMLGQAALGGYGLDVVARGGAQPVNVTVTFASTGGKFERQLVSTLQELQRTGQLGLSAN